MSGGWADRARLGMASARRYQARRSNCSGGLILMYHEIAFVAGDARREIAPPLGLDLFRRQLSHLRRHYEVVSLCHLQERVAQRHSRRRIPVALTFDDDLASHDVHAAPELMRLGLPATFFLGGRSLHSPSPTWWQDLQAIYDRGDASRHHLWHVLESHCPWADVDTDARRLFQTIKMLPRERLQPIAEVLRDVAGADGEQRQLTAAGVGRLLDVGFDVGFHTLRHEVLQTLDDAELRRAMYEGRDAIERVAGRRLTRIAYPYCAADLRVAAAAGAAGFELGVVCGSGAVRPDDYPLLLDRIDGWSDSLASFALRLARSAGS
jgi:peptidoglycan/xylan/chitin deacetylase (PgdA/CDA1 family)